MSLTLRFALMLGALFVCLALLGGYGLYRLSGDLQRALAESASETSRRVVRVLTENIRQVEVDEHGQVREPSDRGEVRVFVDRRDLGDGDTDLAQLAEEALRTLGDRPSVTLPASLSGMHVEVHTVMQHDGVPSLRLEGAGLSQNIPLPRSGLQREMRDFTWRLSAVLAALLLLGLVASIWLAHRVVAPLHRLAQGAARVGAGERGVRVEDGGVREARDTIDAFNQMAGQLEALDAEAQQLRAQQTLAELGEIGRGLAHSLRNPLHSLGLCIEALQSQARSAQQADPLAQTARQQIARLDQSLRGFLALSSGVDAPTQTERLAEVVNDVLLEAQQTWGGHLSFTLEGDTLAKINAVAAELRIMVHTLVANAAEASSDGDTINIAIEADEILRIVVSDRGSGVPENLRSRLFLPHVSSKAHGAGMGLYLAQRIASLRYAGSIRLDDRDGGGTHATLSLKPRAHA